jgi:hypothetical protein
VKFGFTDDQEPVDHGQSGEGIVPGHAFDAVRARHKTRQQLKALLLRQGRRYTGKSSWTAAHERYLAAVSLAHRAQDIVSLHRASIHPLMMSRLRTPGFATTMRVMLLAVSTLVNGCMPSNSIQIDIRARGQSEPLQKLLNGFAGSDFAEVRDVVPAVEAALAMPPSSVDVRAFQSSARPQVRCAFVVKSIPPRVFRVTCSEQDFVAHPSLIQPPFSDDGRAVLRTLVASFRAQFGVEAVPMPRALR